jgi:hypothetical protein
MVISNIKTELRDILGEKKFGKLVGNLIRVVVPNHEVILKEQEM